MWGQGGCIAVSLAVVAVQIEPLVQRRGWMLRRRERCVSLKIVSGGERHALCREDSVSGSRLVSADLFIIYYIEGGRRGGRREPEAERANDLRTTTARDVSGSPSCLYKRDKQLISTGELLYSLWGERERGWEPFEPAATRSSGSRADKRLDRTAAESGMERVLKESQENSNELERTTTAEAREY